MVTGRLHPAFTDAAALENLVGDPLQTDPFQTDPSDPSETHQSKVGVLRVEGDVVVAPGAAETSLRGAFQELTHVGGPVSCAPTW